MTQRNAVECTGVSKRYSNFYLDGIDLTVPSGTVMGFVGPNGAGKSTTLRIIMGLVHQDSGNVRVLGNEMPREQVAAKWEIGHVSEDMRLYPGKTIAFHMKFMKSIYPTWDDAYAGSLLKRFRLVPDQKVRGLSHGQRVKACLLTALARHPRLLVLDEPTTGLDPAARQEILEEMSAVIVDEDRTILFSSHNTQDVERLSDAVTLIHDGAVLFSRDKESLMDDWRRIRLQTSERFKVPDVPGLITSQISGHTAALVVNRHDRDLEQRLCEAGATVSAVERMSLEEIFLISIAAGKGKEILQ